MYIPKKYNESEWLKQEALIKAFPLATVITTNEDGKIIANHIPFLLRKDKSTDKVYLEAHIARVNHQLPSLSANDNVLIIFQSNDTYISPSYYPGKADTHKYVPTWDFASLHIYGSSKIVNDSQFVKDQLVAFTAQNEDPREVPWSLDEAPESYVRIMMKAITGLQIEIKNIECKYKFEQGHSSRDVKGVVDGLAEDKKHELSQFVKDANIVPA